MTKPTEPSLTLGWQVTPALEPRYWLQEDPKVGKQTPQDLVQVEHTTLDCHTAIVARSGSGKSYFLGRLIEELLLGPKCRCIILDPNADFRRFNETVKPGRWEEAKYDRNEAKGHLPTEPDREKFCERWNPIEKRLLRAPDPWSIPGDSGASWQVQWKLPLQSLSFELLADNADQTILSDLYHCHQLVRALSFLMALQYESTLLDKPEADAPHPTKHNWNVIETAKELFNVAKPIKDFDQRRGFIATSFFLGLEDGVFLRRPFSLNLSSPFLKFGREVGRKEVADWIDEIADHIQYISRRAARYYFGRAAAEVQKNIVEARIDSMVRSQQLTVRAQLTVVDLSSFPDPAARLLAVDSALVQIWLRMKNEWEHANRMKKDVTSPDQKNIGASGHVNDSRIPTYVVVDEAHNLMPVECEGRAARTIRAHFQRIAAEGRKYGLFLVICSQRPEKLDPVVLSECGNVAIMKLGSRSVLEASKRLFGLEDLEKFGIGRCLEFPKSRVLLTGKWAEPPQILFTAMRRTQEGGKDLNPDYWKAAFRVGEKPAEIEIIIPSSNDSAAEN